eukprot:5694017-Pleurochrysis_carterae.AAC.3
MRTASPGRPRPPWSLPQGRPPKRISAARTKQTRDSFQNYLGIAAARFRLAHFDECVIRDDLVVLSGNGG